MLLGGGLNSLPHSLSSTPAGVHLVTYFREPGLEQETERDSIMKETGKLAITQVVKRNISQDATLIA